MNFKKAASFLTALSMSALLLTSCGEQSEVPEGMKLVANDFANYEFFVPEDWTEDKTIDGFLSAKAGDNCNVSIQTMTWDNRHSTLDEYFRSDYFRKLTSTFKTISLIEDECDIENATVGTVKNRAAKYVYTIESDGAAYKFMQYFTYNAGNLYILTYTGKVSDTAADGTVKEVSYFADHLEEVQSIVDNFVF